MEDDLESYERLLGIARDNAEYFEKEYNKEKAMNKGIEVTIMNKGIEVTIMKINGIKVIGWDINDILEEVDGKPFLFEAGNITIKDARIVDWYIENLLLIINITVKGAKQGMSISINMKESSDEDTN